MAKRIPTPYPRLRIKELQRANKEERENEAGENARKHRRQSSIVGPKPRRGREVFVEILNKEWELVGGRVLPANTNPDTVEADSQVSRQVLDRV